MGNAGGDESLPGVVVPVTHNTNVHLLASLFSYEPDGILAYLRAVPVVSPDYGRTSSRHEKKEHFSAHLDPYVAIG